MDDFPVLKAFQQYIDAEQAKARKRLLSLGIFFGILTGAIIAVFVVMLMNMTVRNQQLNDRLVEYAMKDRDRQSAVVVQPPQDNAAILALTAKLDELQKKLDESRAKSEKDAAVAAERARLAAIEASKPKEPSPEELEIKRLKALLEQEREKAAEQARQEKERAAAEKERKRQEELEAYRRKYYPELYGLPKTVSSRRQVRTSHMPPKKPVADNDVDLDDDDNDLLDDDSAIDYFDSDDDSPAPAVDAEKKHTKARSPKAKTTKSISTPVKSTPVKEEKTTDKAAEQPYVAPAEVKGKSTNFRIPVE